MGGKGKKGALQLHVLEPADNGLRTTFRGRKNELETFARCIESNLSVVRKGVAEAGRISRLEMNNDGDRKVGGVVGSKGGL